MTGGQVHFRFIHVSDLHIGQIANQENVIQLLRERRNSSVSDVAYALKRDPAYKRSILGLNSHDEVVLKFLAAFCYDRRDDVNGYIFTGDLARTGMRSDMTAASDFFRLYVKEHFFKPNGDVSIANIKRKKYIMPGNHDRYKNQAALVNSTVFDSSFLGLYPGGQRVYSGIGGHGSQSLGFVFVDFSFSRSTQPNSKEHRYGGGKVTGELIAKLVEETTELRRRQPGAFVVWVSHFAPFDCGDDLVLSGYQTFLEAAEKLDIRLILCGHTHNKSYAKYGNTMILCAGSATCVDSRDRHFVHILDIKIGRRVTVKRENYRFDTNARDFVRHEKAEKFSI